VSSQQWFVEHQRSPRTHTGLVEVEEALVYLLNIRSTIGRAPAHGSANPRYDICSSRLDRTPSRARKRLLRGRTAARHDPTRAHMRAKFRETKAEGGWGVVCSGYDLD